MKRAPRAVPYLYSARWVAALALLLAACGGSGGTNTTSTTSASQGGGGAGGTSSTSSTTAPKPCSVDGDCDDKNPCNGVETCDQGLCAAGAAVECDDGVMCTDDFCDSATGGCKHVANDTRCSDGLVCNGPEVCDPVGGAMMTGCRAGTAPSCDDGVPCTADACDEAAGGCVYTPDATRCDDGVFCNGAEICDATLGCVEGPPPDCDDAASCTADACDEAQKKCTHTPQDAVCDDGLGCNGVETCDPASGAAGTGCKTGTPVACPSDGIACTVDACDEATLTCLHTADNALCPAGQFCVKSQGGCAAGAPCNTSADCDDGNACNGVESCVNGACKAGTPVSCDDGLGCTVDACVPATGACTHTPNHAACNDGLACNGVEICDVAKGCTAGAPVDCDDGVSCTVDACVEPGGTCTHTPRNYLCNDGQLCNGLETCDAVKGCQPGAPFVCPASGVACVSTVCDTVLNACKPIPDSSLCPCGQTCDPKLGCGSFCTVKTCQGKVYQCGDCLDNDGDCKIDAEDDQCLGPCDDTEDSFAVGIPGANNAPCKQDCYFDGDTGAGNDDCYWSHKCDALEVGPGYPPESSKCAYDPSANISGSTLTCAQAFASQSTACAGYCGPLTPNGCDCFGCCIIPGAATPVWLGSENPAGTSSCNIANIGDPTKCKPCTQVAACLNTCDHCELCVGKTVLPPDCVSQTCPTGVQACGLPGQAACSSNATCITGCCQTNPT